MLKKRNRITKRSDFLKLKNKGAVNQSPFFGFIFLENIELKESKFGFIISKKISKKAVVRNKIKRILSQIVKENLILLNKKIEGIFLIKHQCKDLNIVKIKDEVKRIFENV